MSTLPPAIFLMGPTACGKTLAAVELAQQLPVEIISVDSALIYRDMDIGTAKPEASLLAQAPHHLIDIIDPTQSYSAAAFRHDALNLMNEITRRGHIPLLVGGTMLYFRALHYGLNALPQADHDLRAELNEKSDRIGWPAMHAELALIDPEMAAFLKPNDAQRIQRALEIYWLTGQPMSALLKQQQRQPMPYQAIQLALIPAERSQLHARIATRFAAMLELGLVEELRSLQKNYSLQPGLPSMRCVGYRQAWQYLAGEINESELLSQGIAATRQLAKRQLTWLRGMPGILRFDCFASDLMQQILAAVRSLQKS